MTAIGEHKVAQAPINEAQVHLEGGVGLESPHASVLPLAQ